MYKIQKSVTLMGLAFVFCAALPVGSNAEIHTLEAESKVNGPNDKMIECVEQKCFKPIRDCLTTDKACLDVSKIPLKAACYSTCSQKLPSIQTCYVTICMKNNLQSEKE